MLTFSVIGLLCLAACSSFVADSLASSSSDASTISFSNPAAQKYYVDGTSIPEVDWDAGPSWAGLMPISAQPNETRQLFFWFWPTNNASNANDLTFWTNGGPGCSSLQGLLTENGPISWNWGQAGPTPNKWSWTNLSHMLWVEQPVGTGFTQGTPNISDDTELAEEFYGFMQQFLEVFVELKGKNFYVSGESFAGFYVPHIASYIYDHQGLDLNLKGMWLSDPSISYDVVEYEIPALKFVQNNRNLLPLNSTYMAEIQQKSNTCGYTDYVEKYVTYPPAGLLPMPVATNGGVSASEDCKIRDEIGDAALRLNPGFDNFRASNMWPIPWSVLGSPHSSVQKYIYFNRTDPASRSVYVNRTGQPHRDTSKPSAFTVLPDVIEKNERTVIVQGLEDFVVIAEGTRIAIQNMTWSGAQGFQTPIEPESFTVRDFGIYGSAHVERNLTYIEVYYSGHYVPQFVPWAAYQVVVYLLGQQDSPSSETAHSSMVTYAASLTYQ